jgi:hypothetical protein
VLFRGEWFCELNIHREDAKSAKKKWIPAFTEMIDEFWQG